jgi:hypothetical protein
VITPAAFPIPQRILTGNPATDAKLAHFADQQADGAQRAAETLAPLWRRARTDTDRYRALEAAHAVVVGWRYDIARQDGQHVHRHNVGRERFLLPITDATLNWDRLNPTAKDGAGTPGEAVMRSVEAMAREQFSRHPGEDTIHNVVDLGHAALIGTTLVRGRAARQVAADVTRRLAARGITGGAVDFGEDPLFARNPCDASRVAFFRHALMLLAGPADPFDDDARARWYQALYLLLLAPKYKRGGDAIARTFAVAAAEIVLDGDIPTYPHDVDFRAFVLPQRQFLDEVQALRQF